MLNISTCEKSSVERFRIKQFLYMKKRKSGHLEIDGLPNYKIIIQFFLCKHEVNVSLVLVAHRKRE